MFYQNCRDAKDISWELLLKYKINSLPVKISSICKGEGILLCPFQKAEKNIQQLGWGASMRSNDGFAIVIRGKKHIFWDDALSVKRQRFAIAHELGHYINGDVGDIPTRRNCDPDDRDDEIERKANIVASRILAPACVLWGLGINNAEGLSEVCDISMQAAQWRMRRMHYLYERENQFLKLSGKSYFLQSAQEKQVYRQFESWIKEQREWSKET